MATDYAALCRRMYEIARERRGVNESLRAAWGAVFDAALAAGRNQPAAERLADSAVQTVWGAVHPRMPIVHMKSLRG